MDEWMNEHTGLINMIALTLYPWITTFNNIPINNIQHYYPQIEFNHDAMHVSL